jgi:hypothetical protein
MANWIKYMLVQTGLGTPPEVIIVASENLQFHTHPRKAPHTGLAYHRTPAARVTAAGFRRHDRMIDEMFSNSYSIRSTPWN